jgi:hemerythrin superfamily protein
MGMQLIALFLKDHLVMRTYLSKILELGNSDASSSTQLLIAFQKVLDRHTYEEEHFLYPETKKKPETRPETLEGWEEHRLIGQLFTEMKGLPLHNEKWTAKLKVMKETLFHHLKEEEEELFPEAEKRLSQSLLQELGEKALISRKNAL